MKYKIEPIKQDNTKVTPKLLSKPKPPVKTNTTSEFIFNPKTGKQEYNPNAKMGLENVSPEFALMTGGVGAGIKGVAGATVHGAAQGAVWNASNLTGSKQDLSGLTTDVLGGAVGGAALKGVGNLVKVIKPNVYKVNPFAFKAKSDMGYRMLGEEGFKDAVETGVLRAKPAPNPTNARISLERNINRNPNTGKLQGALDRPYFADGKIDTRYAADYMAEVNKSKNNLVPIDTHNGIAPMTAGNIPIEKATLYKRDWLMGYKKINSTSVKPTIKSKIDNLIGIKLNNQENYYRMIGGKEGLNDITESGIIRPNQNGIFADRHAYYTKGLANDAKNPVVGSGVKKNTFYKGPYVVEVSPNGPIPNSAENLSKNWNFYKTNKGEHLSINQDNVKIFKQNWLGRYNQIKQ